MKLFLVVALVVAVHGQTRNLAQLASDLGATTLVGYLVRAGLADTIASRGTYTVFGPTNDAFNSLPASLRNRLDTDIPFLRQALLYHVISGRVRSGSLTNDLLVDSLEAGKKIRINVYQKDTGKVITATGSQVISADREASNGVIHVVNKVMLAPDRSVTDYVINNRDFSTLLTAVSTAGLADILGTPGPFTVFAPTNAAFAKIPPATLSRLLANKAELTRVLQNHVVGATAYSVSLSNGQTVNTLGGNPINVRISGGVVSVNEAKVAIADVSVTNGVIHAIDTVLLETSVSQTKNLAELATELGATTLVNYLVRAGLASTIATGGTFTVFGPTNDAFAALPPALKNRLDTDIPFLRQALLYHVINGNVKSGSLRNDMLVDSLEAGKKIRVNVYHKGQDTVITATGSQVISADKEASNGVIHVVNKVMLAPDRSVTDYVINNRDFSTLLTAVSTADLAEFLGGTGPFTVFAPTNAAFAKVPAADLSRLLANKTELTRVLKNHVVGTTAYSVSLSDSQVIHTLGGNPIKVKISGGTVSVNEARVVAADVSVTNGVIHAIDTVLLEKVEVETGDPNTVTIISLVTALLSLLGITSGIVIIYRRM